MSAYFGFNQPTFYKSNFLLIPLFSLVLLNICYCPKCMYPVCHLHLLIPLAEAGSKKKKGSAVSQCFFSVEQEIKEIVEQTGTLIIVAFQQNVSQLNRQ